MDTIAIMLILNNKLCLSYEQLKTLLNNVTFINKQVNKSTVYLSVITTSL